MKTTEATPDIIRQFFLEENPNPERIGCPPGETLKAAAEKRLPVNDPARLHLGRCSECFAEYRGYRLDWENKRASQRRFIGWAVAAALLIAAIGGVMAARHHVGPKQGPEQIAINTPPKPPTQGTPPTPPIVDTSTKQETPPPPPPKPGDLTHHPKTPHRQGQGDKGENPPSQPIVNDELVPATLDLALDHPKHQQGTRQLQAAQLALSLTLPPSSVPGAYELNLTQDVAGDKVVVTALGVAVMHGGKLSLNANFPLQSVTPGDYFLFVAQKDDAVQNNGAKTNSGQQIFGNGQSVYEIQVVPR